MRRTVSPLALLFMCLCSFATAQTSNPLWLRYPAISPDGSTIAFTYKGDIYRVPAQGGVAQILTTNSAHDFMPVWSPDGTKIAFASNRYGDFDIFVMPANGGEPTRLTFHSANEYPSAFSPDGKNIIFAAHIQDDVKNILFPDNLLTELYSVPTEGGRTKQILTTPAEDATYSPDGKYIAYHDVKGYEDKWRKHHTSSVTRDIWLYNTQTQKHKKMTSFEGEDRNPIFAPDGKTLYYLSEKNGSFNVMATGTENPTDPIALTKFDKHPVRFLSVANNGMLCFGFNGEIYTLKQNQEPQKIAVSIAADQTETTIKYDTKQNGATEMALSPDGKEVAFVIRGDIYVTSSEYSTTKRITNTPEQERSVSFSPDGKKILYTSERNGSWKIYQTSIVSDKEPNFALSSLLKEEPIVETEHETFQPLYSPDGKEIAFIQERTTLRIINLESKKTRTVLDAKYNYSYSDGDQWYQWSPDSKWIVAQYMEYPSWPDVDIALIKADGSGQIQNLTRSGYSDEMPKWCMGGNTIIWLNDKMGMRSHGSWGSQFDVYAMFMNKEAYDEFNLSKHEWKLLDEKRKEEKKKKEKEEKESGVKDKKGKTAEPQEKKIDDLTFDLDGIDDRKERLTINSSNISDAILTSNGEKLYYLSRFEKGYDLWVNNLKDKETKLLIKIDGNATDLQIDKDEKYIFFLSNGTIKKVEIVGNKQETVSYSAESTVNFPEERSYIFEHMWRQVLKKFYDPNIHGIDWNFYKAEYSRFLPHINNNFDYSEMASELLGELNGSHTGCRYRTTPDNADKTASLGVFFDFAHTGNGARIAEIMDKSPLISAKSKIKAGTIIEKIDDVEIPANKDFYALLNRKEGKIVLLNLLNPTTNERWTETVKPISLNAENDLLYKRYVKICNSEVERLSGGRIGYVHVEGMNSQSFREVYSDLLGKHRSKGAVVVDTRFNGGGWLHDDLATLLSGKKYADFIPRGQHIGTEPISKWYKPSAVLIGEGNYSDAHGFPYTYKSLGIGKLIGMPVPGTMTAVWWERQIDPTLVFGIPQMGVKDNTGKYLENQQLYPDIQVHISPEDAANGTDTQLQKAVEELLKQI